ncbi:MULTISPECIES: DNA polymerase III subunit chi [unclassified Microbulbifer]|uniref:DNA polymerase III subunit chi n=1 Tax=Microbulbifer spongiae TaxID=2944933 RepID=A0ABY9E733_9GAMM|nr:MULTISPECIES: DNA polymerase III subunit chi [unclassified Microbulbifer]MDP5209181.1 DNA polymerase III subunit chi [Microbulbifer sp. 2205BS26-8]WKD48823.1 DNA polymerase III subunit chi [Microbulbifer sp. MI-G]
MTQIDFYILSSQQLEQADIFACRLAEKAYRTGLGVLLAVDNPERAEQLNRLLWTFREDSFVPHALQGTTPHGVVEINSGGDPGVHHGLMINLCSALPNWFSRFERLAEIVVQQPQALQRSRTRFGLFRERGYPLKSHKINQNN